MLGKLQVLWSFLGSHYLRLVAPVNGSFATIHHTSRSIANHRCFASKSRKIDLYVKRCARVSRNGDQGCRRLASRSNP